MKIVDEMIWQLTESREVISVKLCTNAPDTNHSLTVTGISKGWATHQNFSFS